MRKHGVSYHDYDDTISFKTGFCTHIEAPGFSFSKQPQQLKNEAPTLINEFKPIKILKRSDQSTFNESRKFSPFVTRYKCKYLHEFRRTHPDLI